MRAILILIQTREIQILIAVTHQCSLIRQIAPSLAGQNPPRTMTRRLGAEPGWSGESLESILNLDYPLRSPSPGQSPAPRPAPRHIRADDESGPDPTTPNASPCWDRCAGTAASGCGRQWDTRDGVSRAPPRRVWQFRLADYSGTWSGESSLRCNALSRPIWATSRVWQNGAAQCEP